MSLIDRRMDKGKQKMIFEGLLKKLREGEMMDDEIGYKKML